MIRKRILIGLLPLLLITPFPLISFDIPDFFSFVSNVEDIDEDMFTADVMDYEKPDYTPQRTIRAFTKSCNDDCEGIIQAQNIFQRDLYNFTYPLLQRRSLLDNPQYYFYACLPCWCGEKIWQPFVHIFYNEAHKANLTRNRTGISAYLAFENIPNFEQFGLNNIDAQRVLSLFKDLKVQQRRTGVMLGTAHRYIDWYFSFRTPVEYLIRNFFLDDQEVKAIQGDPIFNDANPTTDDKDEVHKFAREHLIADRIGIGDTRINVGYFAVDKPDRMLVIGGEMTVPTAFALKKGLYGNHFSKNAPTPTLDLCELCNLINNDIVQAEEILLQFGIKALDRLSTILLETGLGNNGHLGIGPVIEHRMCVTPKLEFRTRTNLEYIIPARERRFFILKKNPEDFERLNNLDPDNSHEDLKFLEQQIIQTFFPEGYNTQVHPGLIFKLTNELSGSLAKNKILINLGHDLWWQQGEKLGKINAPPGIRENLRRDIAKRPPAFQSTLFASLTYFRRGRKYDWCLKLYGDRTFLRSGIGREFNFGLRFEFLL